MKLALKRVLLAFSFFVALLLCLFSNVRAEITLSPNFHSVESGGYWGNLSTWQENLDKDCAVDTCVVPDVEDIVEINGTVLVDGNRGVSGLLVGETGVLQNRPGYLYNLAVDGDIINNGTIKNDPNSSFNIQVSGSIQNNGIFSPTKIILLDDVEVINTTSIGGLLDCGDHALIVNAPNILSLESAVGGVNIFNGSGIIDLKRSVRGVISGNISEMSISGNQIYKYIDAEISVPKVIFKADSLIAGEETIINGDVEIDSGIILQNWNGYRRTLIVNGNIINNGIVQNNYSNPLYVQTSGNIENNGAWSNARTSVIWDSVFPSYEFAISGSQDDWSDPTSLAVDSYEVSDFLDEVKYWRVRPHDMSDPFTIWSEVKTINGDLSENQAPVLNSLSQYKSDGATELLESNKTAGDTVVFSAILDDADGDQVALQVELRGKEDDFTGEDLLGSGFVSAGEKVSITTDVLADGEYHWRARVVDERGAASEWQEFGEVGNTDIEIKIVPFYTQNLSNYPSVDDTDEWYELEYANGYSEDYYCGSQIFECGCAITSAIMMMRYYGITESIDGGEVNPGELNEWLKSSADVIGYQSGSVNWLAIPKYAEDPITGNKRIVFSGRYDGSPDSEKVKNLLDEDLNDDRPVIIRDDTYHGHFLLASEKLFETYRVRDPYWYNTKTLDDDVLPSDSYKTDYNNHYDGIRRYTDDISLAYLNSLDFVIASPAELLVTDSEGRRLGKNPIDGVEYFEIEGGTYTSEGIGDLESGTLSDHLLKSVWIPNPGDGEYQVKVIGTGEGDYTLYSTITDQSGDIQSDVFESITELGLETEYDLIYDSDSVEDSEISLAQKTIEDVIADIERAYTEGMITREKVKIKLIRDLERIQIHVERYGTQIVKKQDQLETRLSKCAKSENSQKCREKILKLYAKTKADYGLDKVQQKIVVRLYESILSQLKNYQNRGWISDEGYNLIYAGINSLIINAQENEFLTK